MSQRVYDRFFATKSQKPEKYRICLHSKQALQIEEKILITRRLDIFNKTEFLKVLYKKKILNLKWWRFFFWLFNYWYFKFFFTFKCHMQKSVISIGKKGQLSRRQNTFKTQRPSSPSVTESEKKGQRKVGISSSLTVQIVSRLDFDIVGKVEATRPAFLCSTQKLNQNWPLKA